MKLKLLTSQIKFDIEIWNLNQIQIKFWRFDLKLDSNSNLLTCQKFELDSNSSSSRNFRLANRIKSTHSSLKLDLTINLFNVTIDSKLIYYLCYCEKIFANSQLKLFNDTNVQRVFHIVRIVICIFRKNVI